MVHFTGVDQDLLLLCDDFIPAASDQSDLLLRLEDTEIDINLRALLVGIDGLGAEITDISAGNAFCNILLRIQPMECL